MPTVLGINRTQDASICLIRGSSVILNIQKERLTRQKHHWGKVGDLRDWYFPALEEYFRQPIDLVVECFSSDPEIQRSPEYDLELDEVLGPGLAAARRIRISHHLAHAYSVFPPSPFDSAAVMIVDCQGSPMAHLTEEFTRSTDPLDWVEVSSFYRSSRDSVECLDKQTWDGDWTRPVGLGCFYFLLAKTLFTGEGNEGKVMGLASHGDPSALRLPPLEVREHRVFIPDEWLAIFSHEGRFGLFREAGNGSFRDCADLAAAGQRAFEDALLQISEWLAIRSGSSRLCFAGGTALNCVANGRLLRESRFDEVFIPPVPHDGGTALGCALYGLIEHLRVPSTFRWSHDFLGPDPQSEQLVSSALAESGFTVLRPEELVDDVVSRIDVGQVVGLFHGAAESGPRALGHRSILADPRRPEMHAHINSRVKGRESFRPLAPAVLLEDVSLFFDMHHHSPFMQFAASVRPAFRQVLPAITHVDGSARIQTVTRAENPLLYEVLRLFRDRTGVSVVLNTSLNGPGEPIVETLDDALSLFSRVPLDVLVVPPFVLTKSKKYGHD